MAYFFQHFSHSRDTDTDCQRNVTIFQDPSRLCRGNFGDFRLMQFVINANFDGWTWLHGTRLPAPVLISRCYRYFDPRQTGVERAPVHAVAHAQDDIISVSLPPRDSFTPCTRSDVGLVGVVQRMNGR